MQRGREREQEERGRERWDPSEFEASLVSLHSKFQESQHYKESPCLKMPKAKNKQTTL